MTEEKDWKALATELGDCLYDSICIDCDDYTAQDGISIHNCAECYYGRPQIECGFKMRSDMDREEYRKQQEEIRKENK